jgi:hypothetical protein
MVGWAAWPLIEAAECQQLLVVEEGLYLLSLSMIGRP